MASNLTIGIVIYNEISKIQNLILSLKTELDYHMKNTQVDWIFVFNHQHKKIREASLLKIKNILPSFNYFENSENNLGFARNMILSHAKTDFVYFTDPDIEHPHQSLSQLFKLAEISSDEKHLIGFTGPVIHKSTQPEMNSMFALLQNISKIFPFSFQIQNHSYLNTVDHAPTCHLLLVRSRAVHISGFSENIYSVGEDLDFSHRAYAQGFRFLFSPTSKVIHHQNMNLTSWCKKIRNFGRAQIMVHRKNSNLPVRLYRLFPLVFSFLPVLVLLIPTQLIFIFLLVAFIVYFTKRHIVYLGLTLFSYSLGELFEIFQAKLNPSFKKAHTTQQTQLEKFSLQHNL